MRDMAQAMRTWSARRWWAAVGLGSAIAVTVALPTDVLPNPIFGRAIEVTWWSYPVVVITGILGGLLAATYVREPGDAVVAADEVTDQGSRWGMAGTAVSFFAVGCPVCNKLVLLALGSSGAMTWFAPVQPLLAVLAVVALGWGLSVRLRTTCPVG